MRWSQVQFCQASFLFCFVVAFLAGVNCYKKNCSEKLHFILFIFFLQVLESLSLADSKLKQDTACIINALGSNNSLTLIDLRYTSKSAVWLAVCLSVCLPLLVCLSLSSMYPVYLISCNRM